MRLPGLAPIACNCIAAQRLLDAAVSAEAACLCQHHPPAQACTTLAFHYHPPTGWRRTPDGCVLDSWLLPDACILPPPWPVMMPLLVQQRGAVAKSMRMRTASSAMLGALIYRSLVNAASPAVSLPTAPLPADSPQGRWERQSQKLAVSAEAKEAFNKFIPYFEGEAKYIGDTTLLQEVDILKKLAA